MARLAHSWRVFSLQPERVSTTTTLASTTPPRRTSPPVRRGIAADAAGTCRPTNEPFLLKRSPTLRTLSEAVPAQRGWVAGNPSRSHSVRSGSGDDLGGHVGGGGVAVRRAHALHELLVAEGVLLGADSLDDVRRQHASDLGRAFVAEAPLEPGEEARAERVADAGRFHRSDPG